MCEAVPLFLCARRLAAGVVRAEPSAGRQPLLHVQRVAECARLLPHRALPQAGSRHSAALEASYCIQS